MLGLIPLLLLKKEIISKQMTLKCERCLNTVLSKGFDFNQCITSTASEAYHISFGLLPSTNWTCPCENINAD